MFVMVLEVSLTSCLKSVVSCYLFDVRTWEITWGALIHYRWALNSSRGWKDIAAPPNAETLQFRPEMEAEFGTVACWASNDVGRQREPCLFRFYPAGITR